MSHYFIRYLNEAKEYLSPEKKNCFQHMMLTISIFQDTKVLPYLFLQKVPNTTSSKTCSWLQEKLTEQETNVEI